MGGVRALNSLVEGPRQVPSQQGSRQYSGPEVVENEKNIYIQREKLSKQLASSDAAERRDALSKLDKAIEARDFDSYIHPIDQWTPLILKILLDPNEKLDVKILVPDSFERLIEKMLLSQDNQLIAQGLLLLEKRFTFMQRVIADDLIFLRIVEKFIKRTNPDEHTEDALIAALSLVRQSAQATRFEDMKQRHAWTNTMLETLKDTKIFWSDYESPNLKQALEKTLKEVRKTHYTIQPYNDCCQIDETSFPFPSLLVRLVGGASNFKADGNNYRNVPTFGIDIAGGVFITNWLYANLNYGVRWYAGLPGEDNSTPNYHRIGGELNPSLPIGPVAITGHASISKTFGVNNPWQNDRLKPNYTWSVGGSFSLSSALLNRTSLINADYLFFDALSLGFYYSKTNGKKASDNSGDMLQVDSFMVSLSYNVLPWVVSYLDL